MKTTQTKKTETLAHVAKAGIQAQPQGLSQAEIRRIVLETLG